MKGSRFSLPLVRLWVIDATLMTCYVVSTDTKAIDAHDGVWGRSVRIVCDGKSIVSSRWTLIAGSGLLMHPTYRAYQSFTFPGYTSP